MYNILFSQFYKQTMEATEAFDVVGHTTQFLSNLEKERRSHNKNLPPRYYQRCIREVVPFRAGERFQVP